jgi:hypothetical protein
MGASKSPFAGSGSALRRVYSTVKVVSERLGHATVTFTMGVYQHVMPGQGADAAAAFSVAVFGEVRAPERCTIPPTRWNDPVEPGNDEGAPISGRPF